eukprot:gene22433-biopygen10252
MIQHVSAQPAFRLPGPHCTEKPRDGRELTLEQGPSHLTALGPCEEPRVAEGRLCGLDRGGGPLSLPARGPDPGLGQGQPSNGADNIWLASLVRRLKRVMPFICCDWRHSACGATAQACARTVSPVIWGGFCARPALFQPPGLYFSLLRGLWHGRVCVVGALAGGASTGSAKWSAPMRVAGVCGEGARAQRSVAPPCGGQGERKRDLHTFQRLCPFPELPASIQRSILARGRDRVAGCRPSPTAAAAPAPAASPSPQGERAPPAPTVFPPGRSGPRRHCGVSKEP